MSPAMQEDLDRQLEEGLPVTQGVPPELPPRAERLAELWSSLRSSTPGDHPIALSSIAVLVGNDGVLDVLPWMQTMDRAYFDSQRERSRAEREQAEKRAKARAGRRR